MNENSTIVRLLTPMSDPPTMVAAERETPGTMAIAWKSPIRSARRYVISAKFVSASECVVIRSKMMSAMPPTTSDARTTVTLPSKYDLTALYTVNPITPVGRNATASFVSRSQFQNLRQYNTTTE